MALPIGFLLFILGCVALIAWAAEALVFLKGAVAFGLVLWGLVAMLVGYSERKARREFKTAVGSEPSAASNAENGSKEPASVS